MLVDVGYFLRCLNKFLKVLLLNVILPYKFPSINLILIFFSLLLFLFFNSQFLLLFFVKRIFKFFLLFLLLF